MPRGKRKRGSGRQSSLDGRTLLISNRRIRYFRTLRVKFKSETADRLRPAHGNLRTIIYYLCCRVCQGRWWLSRTCAGNFAEKNSLTDALSGKVFVASNVSLHQNVKRLALSWLREVAVGMFLRHAVGLHWQMFWLLLLLLLLSFWWIGLGL